MRGSRFINRILGGLSTRESRRGAIPRSFSRFFSYARRRTRDAVPADINYCGVPDPAQKVQRCPLEIISAAGRRRCLPTDFVFFDFSSLFSLPRPLRSLRGSPRSFSPLPPLLLPSISSVEPADRTCHRSSFHPRHDACLSTPWTGPTFYRDHLPPLSLLPRSFCPLLVFPFFFPSSPSRFIPLSLSSFNFPPIEMKTKLGGIPLPPVVFDNNST